MDKLFLLHDACVFHNERSHSPGDLAGPDLTVVRNEGLGHLGKALPSYMKSSVLLFGFANLEAVSVVWMLNLSENPGLGAGTAVGSSNKGQQHPKQLSRDHR